MSADNAIAVVGMSCYFPGASSPEEFWDLLSGGRESIRPVSQEELARAGVPESQRDRSDFVPVAAVLDGADTFDPSFFRLSPNEARLMDPQHRKFLECSWEALEHAGVVPGGEEAIGVFAGSGMNWYYMRNLAPNSQLVETLGHFVLRHTANDKDFLATRVSYQFDLRGPSVNIQTACSTSLVAIHKACESLLAGECDIAIAGGSTIEVPLNAGYRYREGEVQSPDGRCRPFDAAAAGTVFGSGCGAVVLRRVADALEDRQTIHAQIIGSAINNDGARKVGFLAPSLDGHADVIEEAMAVAEVEPESISLVEAHGTATRLGDPIELSAFQRAFGRVHSDRPWCAIGSVKGNIGHLDTAAGVASFIKAVLSLSKRTIPASMHFETLNPEIEHEGRPFYVPASSQAWSSVPGKPRRAGISSLGVGGTNAHVILEEWDAGGSTTRDPIAGDELFVWSARSPAALEQVIAETADFLEQHPEVDLGDVAHTLRHGRAPFEVRAFAVAGDPASLIEQLRTPPTIARSAVPANVAFLFPGQGAQFPGMAAAAYAHPVFREWFDRCAELTARAGGPDISSAIDADLREDAAASEQLQKTAVAQPALFAVELAMARALQSFGAHPSMMLGHSIGEYVAACVSGVLSLEDAVRLVVRRGALMQAMPEGSMAAVMAPLEDVKRLISAGLDIAATNAPSSTVVAGPTDEIEALGAQLGLKGIACRILHTSHAFHSRSMEEAAIAFQDEVRTVTFGEPGIPYVSNVTGSWVDGSEVSATQYWSEHIRSAVRFAEGVREILEKRPAVLVEVGPGDTLSRLAEASVADGARLPTVVHSMPSARSADFGKRPITASIGALWRAGVEVDWTSLDRDSRRKIPLPCYPFQRQRLWVEPTEAGTADAHTDDRRPMGGLFAPSWLPQPSSRGERRRPGRVWVLGDGDEIWRSVVDTLEADGWAVQKPEIGEWLAEPSSETVSGWIAELGTPTAIVLGTAYGPEDLEDDGELGLQRSFDALVQLLTGLQSSGSGDPVDLLITTRELLPTPGSSVKAPERLAMVGPCRVVPEETPDLSVRLVDVDVGSALGERILAELSDPAKPPVVAYRGGQRLVPAASPVHIGAASTRTDLEGAVCLITGAFGGVGRCLARWLADQGASKLALVSRSEAGAGAEALLQELAQRGAEAWVETADVTDAEAMAAVVARTVERAGPIDHAFHLAGVLDDRLLGQQSLKDMRRVLAPKVAGTRCLDRALRQHGQRPTVILFSSVSAHLGVPGQIAYSGANAVLDGWAHRPVDGEGPSFRVVDWGMWAEVGMGAISELDAGSAEDLPKAPPQPAPHPILCKYGSRSDGAHVFWGDVGAADHWSLRDHHRRTGGAILPGTGFVDLILSSMRMLKPEAAVTLEGVTFLEPLSFVGGEPRRVLLILTPSGEKWNVEIESLAGRSDRRLHLQATLHLVEGDVADGIPEKLDGAEATAWRSEGHPLLKFGPRWSSLDARVRRDGDVVHNRVRLAEAFSDDLELHAWHPALTDVALGAGLAEERPDEHSAWIPFSYDRLTVTHSPGALLCSRLEVRERSPDSIVADVDLFDAHRRIGRLEGYRFRRVALSADGDTTAESSDGARRLALAPDAALDLLGEFLNLRGLPQAFALPAPLDTLERSLRDATTNDAAGEDHGDRDAAPRPALSTEFIPPSSATERAIAAAWTSQLGIDGVGLDDDFFELGGHSLLLTRILQRLRKDGGVAVPMNQAFDKPTVRRWAAAHEAAGQASEETGRITRVDRAQFPVAAGDLAALPMSFSQRQLWYLQRLNPTWSAYNIPFAIHVEGDLSVPALSQAFTRIANEAEVLRTTYGLVGGEPRQIVRPRVELQLRAEDCTEWSEPRVDEEIANEARRPFDLRTDLPQRVRVLERGAGRYVVLWTLHHIAVDHLAVLLLGDALSQAYEDEVLGRDTRGKLLEAELEYADYAVWQSEQFTAEGALTERIEFWRQHLDGVPHVLGLPEDHPRTPEGSLAGGELRVRLDPSLRQPLMDAARAAGVSPFVFLLTAFKITLGAYAGRDDIITGVPFANRPRLELENVVGIFMNLLPIRVGWNEDTTVRELLGSAGSAIARGQTHQDTPFEKIVEGLEVRPDPAVNPLVQTWLTFQEPPLQIRLPGLSTRTVHPHNGGAKLDLSAWLWDSGDVIEGSFEFSSGVFSQDTIERLVELFEHVIAQMIAHPTARVCELELLPPSQAKRIEQWQGAEATLSARTLNAGLERSFREHAERHAVRDSERRWTYAELEKRAAAVAQTLASRGVGSGDRVGICLTRSAELLPALLGVLGSGAAYVPLDPSFPEERLRLIVEDASCALTLVGADTEKLAQGLGNETLRLDTVAPSKGPFSPAEVSDEDPAYLIYTSGSTGVPKGVVVPHRAVANFLDAMAEAPGLAPEDVLAAVTTLAFDISVLELFLPLWVGGEVAVLEPRALRNGRLLAGALETVGATVLQATPATWRLLLQADAELPGVRALCGGEALPADLADALPSRVGRLFNMFGPTETTVWSTFGVIEPNEPVTIGRPIANTRIKIVDPRGRPTPLGVPGEIWIGGEGVTLGYRNRDNLTASRFITDEWGRWYRTGDLGRWLSDGRLQHLGRMDRQLKVRGFRIEPGDVEAAIGEVAGVSACVVSSVSFGPGDDRLVAYLIPEEGEAPPTSTEVRRALRTRLPDYMIPNLVVPITEIPTLPNGKVDLAGLPNPASTAAPHKDVELRDGLEADLGALWAELLKAPVVRPQDSFFDLGGHSLLAMQVVAAMQEKLGIEVAPRSLYFMSLRQIAESVSGTPDA